MFFFLRLFALLTFLVRFVMANEKAEETTNLRRKLSSDIIPTGQPTNLIPTGQPTQFPTRPTVEPTQFPYYYADDSQTASPTSGSGSHSHGHGSSKKKWSDKRAWEKVFCRKWVPQGAHKYLCETK